MAPLPASCDYPCVAHSRISRFGWLGSAEVPAIALANNHGVMVNVIAYGATLQAVHLPDRRGELADIVLGFDSVEGYVASSSYCGATIGRFANRIAGGRFRLDGQELTVPLNEGANALHSGPLGFDRQLWEIVETGDGEAAFVRLRHVSRAGHQGYPGELSVEARFGLTEASELTIDYHATTDAPTIINLTSHGYWNLGGTSGDVLSHRLTLHARAFLPVAADLIPTGEVHPVAGGAFDFRASRPIGPIEHGSDEQIALAHGYDHNFVIEGEAGPKPRPMALLEDPKSGRAVELWSNQPGLQFYSGNHLGGPIPGKGGRVHRSRQAVALEPQRFPDTPNRPEFGSARLDPGDVYHHAIAFKLFSYRSELDWQAVNLL